MPKKLLYEKMMGFSVILMICAVIGIGLAIAIAFRTYRLDYSTIYRESGKVDLPSVSGAPRVTASRIFAGPTEYPPADFAAYGIVAFPSRATPYDRQRHLMICYVYVATLPHAADLGIPSAEQMVTIWPLGSEEHSRRLNERAGTVEQVCETAVDDYGLAVAQQALRDAARAGIDTSGVGPLLLAWAPATSKGQQNAIVLVSDLSNVTTFEQAQKIFLAWSRDIERDPSLWVHGWDVDQLRTKIQQWVDKYGSRSLAIFGMAR